MDRVKVSDKFAFPLSLDMAPVVGQVGTPGTGVHGVGCPQAFQGREAAQGSRTGLGVPCGCAGWQSGSNRGCGGAGHALTGPGCWAPAENDGALLPCVQHGRADLVYDLEAIMVHKGSSAIAGHYGECWAGRGTAGPLAREGEGCTCAMP